MEFVKINKENYKQVAAIYKEGIATNIATFETVVPDWEIWNHKFLSFGRIAIEKENKILAWASLSPTSKRDVYKGVAEVTVYVKASERGKGLGELLLKELIKISEKNTIWTLQTSIFRENKASLHIHKKSGFRVVGYKEKIAQLHGVWQDNMMLERRSKIIGV
ncbi:GNAT family N-acetyltransferase [Polaribacter sp. Hel1_85]|uniref:GNAT family N-acetyltransferase n=1 Tax=Polaribacter sp. Hel1_85 TaxID=1250005 RepID=UPI00052C77C0|nr:GNAT family N-acetyltransferase [Polaribacter sp. Hel1_85]KGL64195.1 N-acetyltransferase GCN5 [Polaribacter sp. Hel1_85]